MKFEIEDRVKLNYDTYQSFKNLGWSKETILKVRRKTSPIDALKNKYLVSPERDTDLDDTWWVDESEIRLDYEYYRNMKLNELGI